MNRALWLLMGLRLRGWVRRIVRNAQTFRGALVLAVGLFGVALVVGITVLNYFLPGAASLRPVTSDQVNRFGPLGLTLYCVVLLITPAGERAVFFSPAEVNLLFAAPFSRRQLLAYKLMANLLLCLAGALFMMLFLMPYAGGFLPGYVGLVLALLFVQLLCMAVVLLTDLVGAQAYGRRRLVVYAAGAVLLLALLQVGGDTLRLGPVDLFERVERTAALKALLTPARWLVRAFTARELWPELAQYGGLSLAAVAALTGLVFVLDRKYLETIAAASERVYAHLQRVRSSGAAVALAGTGRPRFALRALPWCGGTGPIVWRQLTTALRSLRSVLLFVVIFGGAILLPAWFVDRPRLKEDDLDFFRGLGLILAVGMTLLTLPQLLTFDFRGDIDRIEVLKALPLAPSRLVVGQLLVPVLFLTAVQLILLLLLKATWGEFGPFLLAGAAFAVPVNFLVMGIDNLLFLWFPTRMVASTPGDMQILGRQMLLFLGKGLLLGLVAGVGTAVGVGVFLLARQDWLLTLAAVWLIVAGFAVAMVPLVVLAFRNFDVARDTPP